MVFRALTSLTINSGSLVINNMPLWYLYIIRCSDNSLYTGITTDVDRRFLEHATKNQKSAKYFNGKKAVSVVFRAPMPDKGSALRAEIAVKKLTKEKKELLICGEQSLDLINHLKGE